jgi:hypothetical protein
MTAEEGTLVVGLEQQRPGARASDVASGKLRIVRLDSARVPDHYTAGAARGTSAACGWEPGAGSSEMSPRRARSALGS